MCASGPFGACGVPGDLIVNAHCSLVPSYNGEYTGFSDQEQGFNSPRNYALEIGEFDIGMSNRPESG